MIILSWFVVIVAVAVAARSAADALCQCIIIIIALCSIQYDYLGLLLPVMKLSAAVGLSNLLKSMLVRPDELDKGLGKVFGRIFGETGFCSCTTNITMGEKNRKRWKK